MRAAEEGGAGGGGSGPRLNVYLGLTEMRPTISLLLEGARIVRLTAEGVQGWTLSVPSEPGATYTFYAEDEADAERWVAACRQQALVSASELDLTPRIVKELEVRGRPALTRRPPHTSPPSLPS